MFLSKKELGEKGEEIAVDLLTKKGYKILEMNTKERFGSKF